MSPARRNDQRPTSLFVVVASTSCLWPSKGEHPDMPHSVRSETHASAAMRAVMPMSVHLRLGSRHGEGASHGYVGRRQEHPPGCRGRSRLSDDRHRLRRLGIARCHMG